MREAVPNRDSTWDEGKLECISTGREAVKYRTSCLRLRESHILRQIHVINIMARLMHKI